MRTYIFVKGECIRVEDYSVLYSAEQRAEIGFDGYVEAESLEDAKRMLVNQWIHDCRDEEILSEEIDSSRGAE